ncbi:MAG: TSUP family transporter [Synergistes sp.]|nr:TSUP family transporter [Synergistes sp.]
MNAVFEISKTSLLLVCFLVFIAGFVDASAGGGGIISLPAYFFTGMPAHMALGCNKFSGCCGCVLSVMKFWRGGAVRLRAAIIAAAGSFAGAACGSMTALVLSEHTIKAMVLVILPCAAAVILFKKDMNDEDRSRSLSQRKAALLAVVIGLLIGFYDGIFGPGTGTFAIMAFSALMGFDLKTASGNAKLLNLASNAASVITFAAAGNILYSIAVPAAVCGIAGNFAGAHMALTRGSKFIRPMMLCVLALLMLRILWDLLA